MNYYDNIKQELINNEIYKKVKDYSKNRNDLETYYKVGKLIVEAQGGETRAKYGDNLIKEYSKRLTSELGKGYSTRNLKLMRKFYIFQKGQPVAAQLSWSHYTILLSIKEENKRKYYINECIKNNLSKRNLIEKIKLNEYERLDKKTKLKLALNKEKKIEDLIKNPIIIKNKGYEIISEKILKQLILEDLDNFLTELGDNFTYVGNEYKIKIGDKYNYIDLLLFNIEFNCYVVIELKITELKAEYIGQIKKYMNYVDKNIRKINMNQTIGIIICKKENDFVMEYCSDDRIFSSKYILI